MSSRTLTHLCIAGIFVLAILWVMGSWKTWEKNGDVGLQFMAILLIAVVGGFFVVLVVLPRFGDAMSTAMTSSNEESKLEGSGKAMALVAQGDYEGAIKEYESMLKEKPDDSFSVSEIAKICSDKIGDPVRGLHVLRTHLEKREWPTDDAAFLMFRMVDIYMKEDQYAEARELLEQISVSFPETRHVGNARHKLNEVEQAEFKLAQAQRAKGSQG